MDAYIRTAALLPSSAPSRCRPLLMTVQRPHCSLHTWGSPPRPCALCAQTYQREGFLNHAAVLSRREMAVHDERGAFAPPAGNWSKRCKPEGPLVNTGTDRRVRKADADGPCQADGGKNCRELGVLSNFADCSPAENPQTTAVPSRAGGAGGVPAMLRIIGRLTVVARCRTRAACSVAKRLARPGDSSPAEPPCCRRTSVRDPCLLGQPTSVRVSRGHLMAARDRPLGIHSA